LRAFCGPKFHPSKYKCKNGFFSNWHDLNPHHKEIEKSEIASAHFENGLNQKGRWIFQSKKLRIRSIRFICAITIKGRLAFLNIDCGKIPS